MNLPDAAHLKAWLKYVLTIFEEKTGVLSAMRVVQVPVNYIVVVPFVYVWTSLSLQHGRLEPVDHYLFLTIVGILTTVNGGKCLQAFAES